MKLPPSMQALIDASKLKLEPNTSQIIPCPKCGGDLTAYRNPAGKLMGRCDCGVTIPKG